MTLYQRVSRFQRVKIDGSHIGNCTENGSPTLCNIARITRNTHHVEHESTRLHRNPPLRYPLPFPRLLERAAGAAFFLRATLPYKSCSEGPVQNTAPSSAVAS